MRLVTFFAALILSAVTAFAADVTGAWTMTLDSPQGSAEATLTLKQDGNKVTGTYKGPRNTAPVAGTMTGDDLKLTPTMEAGGQSVTLEFTAKVWPIRWTVRSTSPARCRSRLKPSKALIACQ